VVQPTARQVDEDLPALDVRALRDAELTAALRRLSVGDSAALEQVWDLVADDMFGLALWRTGARADAEDAVQDVFLKLARDARAAREARRPRAYLLRMVHRAAVDLHRRQRPETGVDADLLEAPPDDPGRQLDAAAACALVARLSAKLREVVYLKHFSDLTFAEIARVAGVPQFTAASRYRLAMRRLRERMR
jgi:RNA polymerase sigma-70 factor, ECF subfamily